MSHVASNKGYRVSFGAHPRMNSEQSRGRVAHSFAAAAHCATWQPKPCFHYISG